ncbi:MAG: valine--tRNA ligase [bacterium]
MTNIPKQYNPHENELKWYSFWLSKGFFTADSKSEKKPYCIAIPPPNVTGSLHMGHALNNTLQDILVRWKRMQGYNAFWIFGTDHAGIATQNVVEKQLAKEGITRHDLGREAFIERVWKWREESGGMIKGQLKRLGASCDWSRERFTMDEGLSKAVREVFVRLYEEGYIYKGNYIINWCPRCQTAISDLEVDYEEQKGFLYHLRYPLKGRNDYIVVATTRPETMLGDTAVAVNPEDERYKDLIGEKIILPIVNHEIPIISDSFVDKDFGTGAVKVTPAHDPNDFEMGRRHNLAQIKVMNPDATMNEAAGKYQGLDRFECRKMLVEDLKDEGLIEKIEDYQNKVGHCYRCKTVIEPTLSEQWFVRMKELAGPAIKVVEEGRLNIVPPQWKNTYYEWMYNIRDWCISRQIWWGHRIPVWYCKDCQEMMVARIEPKRCTKCDSPNLEQESDVLDTWFSSALWPFSTLGWPEKTDELKTFYPTSVLVTGFDILFFWVARMIMMGLKFMDNLPFADVYIHALVRDADGQKMSKSKGNVIDPLVIMEKYGTDAFRFTLTAFAAQGRDICLSEERIEGYRNFVNKIWNASRFIFMNIGDYEFNEDIQEEKISLADRWILSRLNKLIKNVNTYLVEYRFNEAAGSLYQFVWHEFCDWYIELSKLGLMGSDPEIKKTTQHILLMLLDNILRLLHPVMPFITEEIWQNLPAPFRKADSIVISIWPEVQEKFIDDVAEGRLEIIKEIVSSIRNMRGEMNIPPSQKLTAILRLEKEELIQDLEEYRSNIINLARLSELKIEKQIEKPSYSSTIVTSLGEIYIPLKGVVDFEEEERRLLKEFKKVETDREQLDKKLSNPSFLEKAPVEVVEEKRIKFQQCLILKEKLEQGLIRVREWKKS